jgi:hypothetical protein
MRPLVLLACAAPLFAQDSFKDPRTGRIYDGLTVTEVGRDTRGVRVVVDGVVDGHHVRKEVLVTSAVTLVDVEGRTLELFYQRPIPSAFGQAGGQLAPKPVMQFSREMAGAMMDRLAIRTYQERKEADRLGFDSVNKMKQFTGQNRTKIAQAAKNGSLDPVADVKAEAEAKRAYRASAEQQDPNIRTVYGDIRMKMQGSFQKAQSPIYAKQDKASDAEQQEFASVCQGIEELRQRFATGSRRVLRSGDMTVDVNNQAALDKHLAFLRSAKVKTEAPFARPDINDAQKVVDALKAAMSLPLSN